MGTKDLYLGNVWPRISVSLRFKVVRPAANLLGLLLLAYCGSRRLSSLQTLRTYHVSLYYAVNIQSLITEAGDYVPVGY